jgi:hypothetical protein
MNQRYKKNCGGGEEGGGERGRRKGREEGEGEVSLLVWGLSYIPSELQVLTGKWEMGRTWPIFNNLFQTQISGTQQETVC